MRYFFMIMIFIWLPLSYATTVVPIQDFDSSRYLGKWYEIARLPNSFEKKCVAPISANYFADQRNDEQINVINQCTHADGTIESAAGIGIFADTHNVGKFKVTFLPKWLRWIPMTKGDYWILQVDYDNIAVVGSPDHKTLWILARSQTVDAQLVANAVKFAHSQGFDTSKLVYNYRSVIVQ